MASDYLLKIDNINGSSKNAIYPGWIEVQSFSWGVSQVVEEGPGRSGKTASRPQFSSLNIAKLTDKASLPLLQACASGKHIGTGILIGLRQARDQREREYFKVQIHDLLVSSYQQSGAAGGDEVPMESLSLNFSKIEFVYREQDEKGSF